jgi:hypothetical protein
VNFSDHNNDTQFLPHIVKPIRIIHLRVTALAIVKIGELLDSTGTIVNDGPVVGSHALEQFWQE